MTIVWVAGASILAAETALMLAFGVPWPQIIAVILVNFGSLAGVIAVFSNERDPK